MKHEGQVKIVTPDWVTDSVEKGCLQEEQIYHPTLIVYPPPDPPTPPTPPPIRVPTPIPPEQRMEIESAPPVLEKTTESAPPVLEKTNVGLPKPVFTEIQEKAPRQRTQKSPKRSPSHQEFMSRSMPNQVISQQLAAAVLERRLSNEDKGYLDSPSSTARPGTPSGTAREALARMVNNRIQVCSIEAPLHDMHAYDCCVSCMLPSHFDYFYFEPQVPIYYSMSMFELLIITKIRGKN